MQQVQVSSPASIREKIRKGHWTKPTTGVCSGYTQANLVVLPRTEAFDFLLFCQRNPKPCPVLDVTDPGSSTPPIVAPNADLRTDLPRYRVYRNGVLTEETYDITDLWDQDMVGFLVGCSFTFENALMKNGIEIRNIEENGNVPMYQTCLSCEPAGVFSGPMVVSMRPIPEKDIARAVQVTSRFPSVHGAPIHIGNPETIGISDLDQPDFGDRVTVKEGEVPVFWACGVTPQAVAMHARPEIMITHAPGHMFITDWKDEKLGVM
ncbi:putative hydro-lyase [Oceanobacillus halotolerans]|uniref:putative hydro-lyase n=1 Tax=Oceanobacillus halotolerans TaxID=2663380 RepID=UPI0013DC9DB8|nr:putative hydro-lyase [Oceanobacillus halotolerans]